MRIGTRASTIDVWRCSSTATPSPHRIARGERVVDDSFLLCFNAHDDYVEFVMPAGRLCAGVDGGAGHQRSRRPARSESAKWWRPKRSKCRRAPC